MKLLANKEKNIVIKYKKRISIRYDLISVDNILIDDKEQKDIAFVDVTSDNDFTLILKNTDEKNLQIYLIENMLLFDIENTDHHYVINNIDDDFLKYIKNTKRINLCVIKDGYIDYYFILNKIIGL